MAETITCLVADDHPGMIEAVCDVLEEHGIEVAGRAQRSTPQTAVIVYTAYGERALLTEALDAGVRGFLLKEAPLSDLVRAVEMVAAGQPYVDPALAGVLATSDTAAVATKLTQRERDV